MGRGTLLGTLIEYDSVEYDLQRMISTDARRQEEEHWLIGVRHQMSEVLSKEMSRRSMSVGVSQDLRGKLERLRDMLEDVETGTGETNG